jgi:hypothetical protein
MIKKMVHDTFHSLAGDNLHDPTFPYRVAELMLEVCEKEGMIPPEYNRPMNYGTGHKLTYSQWLQLPSKIREWELENEKE